MFRQNEEMEMNQEQLEERQQCFFNRLTSLPVMTTTLDQLGSLYMKAKENNKLVNMTMNVAEAGIGQALSTARPVMKKFDRQIDALNEVACGQLDKIEERFPIITKPTDEVVKSAQTTLVDPVTSTVASVKTYGFEKVAEVIDTTGKTLNYGTQKLAAAKTLADSAVRGTVAYGAEKVLEANDYGLEKIQSAKNYGVEKVSAVRDYGVEKVSAAKGYSVEKVTAVKDYGVGKVTAVKDYGVEKVTAVKDYGVGKVTAVKDYGTGKVTAVKDYGVGKVTAVKDYGVKKVTFATNYGIQTATSATNYGIKTATSATNYGIQTATSVTNYGIKKASNARRKIDEVVSHGGEQISGVKRSAIDSAFRAASFGADTFSSTRVGKLACSMAESGLAVADSYLDYYCPPGESEEEEDKSSFDESGIVHKAVIISDKARRRINKKVLREIRSAMKRTELAKEFAIAKIEDATTYAASVPGNLAVVATSVGVGAISFASDHVVSGAHILGNGAKAAYEIIQESLLVAVTRDSEGNFLPIKAWNTGTDYGKQLGFTLKDRSEKMFSHLIYVPREKYNTTRDRLVFIWNEVNKSEEEVLRNILDDPSANHSPETSTTEGRAIATFRHALQKMKWLRDPIIEFIQVTDNQVSAVVNHIRKMTVEEVVTAPYSQLVQIKPRITELTSKSVEVLQQIYGTTQQIAHGRLFSGHLVAGAARAIETIPLVDLRPETNQLENRENLEEMNVAVDQSQNRAFLCRNHSELKAIDDIDNEEYEDDDDEQEEEVINGRSYDEDDRSPVDESSRSGANSPNKVTGFNHKIEQVSNDLANDNAGNDTQDQQQDGNLQQPGDIAAGSVEGVEDESEEDVDISETSGQ